MVRKPDVAKLANDAVSKGTQISKMDPSSLASGIVDDKIPEGRFKRMFNRLKSAAPPYTFEKLASSAYLGPSLHLFGRAFLATIYVVAFFTVFKKGIILALPATIVYFMLYACLTFFTLRYKSIKRVTRITMLRESIILGLVYQSLASIAMWMFPLAIFAAVRNQIRSNPKHLILYIVHALPAGSFVLDTLLLGAAPHFRKFAVPIPVLVECILLFAATKTGKLKKPKSKDLQTFWKIFIAGTIIWAIGSSFIALWISRATSCCANNNNKNDDEDAGPGEGNDVEKEDDEEEEYHDVEMGAEGNQHGGDRSRDDGDGDRRAAK